MSLSDSRITAAAKAELVSLGMNPDAVPFEVEGHDPTGKSALELIISAVAKAVVNEIVQNAVVTTQLDTSLEQVFTAGVPVPTDGGTALQTAWKLFTAAKAADGATGGVK